MVKFIMHYVYRLLLLLLVMMVKIEIELSLHNTLLMAVWYVVAASVLLLLCIFQLLDDILQEVSDIRVALEDDRKEHVRNVMFDMIRLRSPIVNSLFPVTHPHGIIRRS